MTAADETTDKINRVRKCPDCHGNGIMPRRQVDITRDSSGVVQSYVLHVNESEVCPLCNGTGHVMCKPAPGLPKWK